MDRPSFPFSAFVGQERLRLGLLVAAIEPTLGGILISGTKGTGKSTAVRALRALLPKIEIVKGCPFRCPPDDPHAMDDGCRERYLSGKALPRTRSATPFVELPLNATEDRLAGTLDVEHALHRGKRRFEPGLLAAANRGFLYVDEVNLLDDHLVDLLLDAASSGIHVVEREGISHVHPARFVLIGTMNPEEGSLRPQFLDRFGLMVSITSVLELDQRQEIARRRLAFDADPVDFTARWAEAEAELSRRLSQAQHAAPSVEVPGEMLSLSVRLSADAGSAGHRAEIAIVKAARAIAALQAKTAIDSQAIVDAARFVLPHRMSAGPLDTPQRMDQRLQEIVGAALRGVDAPSDNAPVVQWDESFEDSLLSMQIPGSGAAGSIEFSVEKKSPKSGSSSPTG